MRGPVIWTIQGKLDNVVYPLQEFDTKRKAVLAMQSQRQPKTAIYRIGNHHYNFTVNKG